MKTSGVSEEGYYKAIIKDRFDLFNTELQAFLIENYRACSGDLSGRYGNTLLFVDFVQHGCLQIADRMLFQADGQLKASVDPCLFGYARTNEAFVATIGLQTAYGAGSNFYLAKLIYRYCQSNDPQQYARLSAQKITYLDRLYRLDGGKRKYPQWDQFNSFTKNKFEPLAFEYGRLAAEVIGLEDSIASKHCPESARQCYQKMLGDEYIKVAIKEQKSHLALHWLLQQAFANYAAAGEEGHLEALFDCVDLTNADDSHVLAEAKAFLASDQKEQRLNRVLMLGDEKALSSKNSSPDSKGSNVSVESQLSNGSIEYKEEDSHPVHEMAALCDQFGALRQRTGDTSQHSTIENPLQSGLSQVPASKLKLS